MKVISLLLASLVLLSFVFLANEIYSAKISTIKEKEEDKNDYILMPENKDTWYIVDDDSSTIRDI